MVNLILISLIIKNKSSENNILDFTIALNKRIQQIRH